MLSKPDPDLQYLLWMTEVAALSPEKGVRLLEVDGQTAQTIPVFSSGAHSIRVVMG